MHHPIFPPDTLTALAHLNQVHLNGITISQISPVLGLGVLFHSDKYNPECCSLITIDKELILSLESVELASKSDLLLREVLRACCGILGADPGEDYGVDHEVVGVSCLDLLNEDEDEDEEDEIHLWGRNPRLMIMLFLAIMLARGRVESEENVTRERRGLSVRIGSGGIWSVYGPVQHRNGLEFPNLSILYLGSIRYIKFLSGVSLPTVWTEAECALLRGTSLDPVRLLFSS